MASREQIKNLLPILQAFAEGKPIQIRIRGEDWSNCHNTDDFILYDEMQENDYEYRIKPEKKSGWVLVYPDGSMSHPFVTKEEAQRVEAMALPIREIYWEE